MGRVARYKKVKKGFRNDDDADRDRAPSRKKLKKESYSNKVFREMMQMASKKKRDKKKKRRKVLKEGIPSKNEKEEDEEEEESNNQKKEKQSSGSNNNKTKDDVKRRPGESIGQYNRRMRELNNQIIIRNTKALQKTRAKRKNFLKKTQDKKRRKKMAKLERRADSDDEFRQADVVPFGATNDTVPTISVVPKAILPKGQRKVKLPKPLSPALQRERARVMKAYRELLERRKNGLA